MDTRGLAPLGDLIQPTLVHLNLTGAAREAVLEQLADLIPALAGNPAARETLLRALHEREQLHSTGIGDGIALPHARNALVGLVEKPVIVVGRHPTGIPYGALDGKPARLFFLIVAPSVTQHLAVLARISRVLRDGRLRQQLLNATQPAQVVTALREAEQRMYAR